MNLWRIVAAFLFFFGTIVVPVLAALLVFTAPYIIKPGVLPPGGPAADGVEIFGEGASPAEVPASPALEKAEATAASFEDGVKALLARFPEDESVSKAASAFTDELPTKGITSTPGRLRYNRSDSPAAGLIVKSPPYLLQIEGPNRDAVNRRLQRLPVVIDNPEVTYFQKWVEADYTRLFLVIFLYIIAQVFIWPRVASWAARVPADPRAKVVPPGELKSRLLALNELDIPFEVRPGERENELVAAWRYANGRWAGLMAAGGLRKTAEIRMRLTEWGSKVRAQDRRVSVSWQTGADGKTVAASIEISAFRGIDFIAYDRGVIHGIGIQDGKPVLEKQVNYRFHTAEMKTPIIDIVTAAGWDYVPVVTFWRLFN